MLVECKDRTNRRAASATDSLECAAGASRPSIKLSTSGASGGQGIAWLSSTARRSISCAVGL